MASKREDEEGVYLELPEPVIVGIGKADWSSLVDCLPESIRRDFVEAYPPQDRVVVLPRYIFLLLVLHTDAIRRLEVLN